MAASRPGPAVVVWATQDRRSMGARSPWVVRWRVGHRKFSRAFRHRARAEELAARLRVAVADGERFDAATGEPSSWSQLDMRFADWAREWVCSSWPTWSPNTRRSAVEALTRAVPLLVAVRAPAAPSELRSHLRDHLLRPIALPGTDAGVSAGRWLERWSLLLTDITPAVGAEVWDQLGAGSNGRPLAAWTARRFRGVVRACLREAVERGYLEHVPVPDAARAKRLSRTRTTPRVPTALLPTPMQARSILAAVPSHQPRSAVYETFLATIYFAGLRPGEVHALRVEDLELPENGWGAIHVRRTRRDTAARWVDHEEELLGAPKARAHKDPGRTVPIPAEMVERFRQHLKQFPPAAEGYLFTSRTDEPLTQSNVNRAWTRAKRVALTPGHPLHACRVYDLRAAAGTTWIRAAVPIPVVAQRLGHTPDVLLRIYAGVLPDDAELANHRIDQVL